MNIHKNIRKIQNIEKFNAATRDVLVDKNKNLLINSYISPFVKYRCKTAENK